MKRLLVLVVLIVFIVGLVLIVVWKNNQLGLSPVLPIAPVEQSNFQQEIIGRSVSGRKIEAYTYGQGEKSLIFVGGIHGGYEWNSVLLAYRFIDYLSKNPKVIPVSLKVTVIPVLNPDGLFTVTGKEGRFAITDVSTSSQTLASGRFNANKVDLNRNFGCKWQPKSTWQSKTVSAGTKAFSEPEAAALRDFVLADNPDAVIFWHSKSNAVYASECQSGILPVTLDIMNVYSQASGYPAVKSFSSYNITGDAEGWLASINIPAVTVELKTHETVEWEQNLAGIKALFENYSLPLLNYRGIIRLLI